MGLSRFVLEDGSSACCFLCKYPLTQPRDLKLDSGLLYVNRPLTVTGKVNLESDLVALVADGDVVVQGKGQEDGTRVQGLVYTKGSFKAQDSTIVGAVVSARVDGTTELDRVNMVQVPGVTDFEVVVDEQLNLVASQPGRISRLGLVVGWEFQGRFVPFTESSLPELRSLAKVLSKLPINGRGAVQVRYKNQDGSPGAVASGREFDSISAPV